MVAGKSFEDLVKEKERCGKLIENFNRNEKNGLRTQNWLGVEPVLVVMPPQDMHWGLHTHIGPPIIRLFQVGFEW